MLLWLWELQTHFHSVCTDKWRLSCVTGCQQDENLRYFIVVDLIQCGLTNQKTCLKSVTLAVNNYNYQVWETFGQLHGVKSLAADISVVLNNLQVLYLTVILPTHSDTFNRLKLLVLLII